jgi:predicted metal-dependent phosphoesterase TrpH
MDKAKGEVLLSRGYGGFDAHLHTFHSGDVLPLPHLSPRALYRMMDRRGFTYKIFTDHDNMRAHESFQADDAPTGVEIKIRPRTVYSDNKPDYEEPHTLHVNVFNLSLGQFGELEEIAKGRDLYEFLDYLKSAELPHAYNHPLYTEVRQHAQWQYLDDLIKLFDVIEVFSYRRHYKQGLIVLELANRHNKGMVGGSDSHIGNAILANFAPGDDFEECWDNVVHRNSYVVRPNASTGSMCDELLGWTKEFIDVKLKWNSWIQRVIDRLGPKALDLTYISRQEKTVRAVAEMYGVELETQGQKP